MNNPSRRHFICSASGVALLGATGLPLQAAAQQQPAVETLKIICGFGAGGAIDIVARRIGERLTGSYAKSVVVDNRAGAGGRIAIETVKAAPPDGTTLLLTPGAMMYIYPHIYQQLSYNPVTDLTPATLAVNVPMAIGVGPMVPASVKTLSDFIAWCKANPEKANYGHGGAGSMPHFIGVLIEKASGVRLTHAPYKGTQAAIADMMGGQIAAATGPEADFMAHIKGPRARLLAISGPQRTRFNPEVPTFAEQGMKNIVAQEWFGFFMPPRTPADIVQRTASALAVAVRDKTTVDALAQLGLAAQASTPAELAGRLKADLDTWGPIVKSIGFTAD